MKAHAGHTDVAKLPQEHIDVLFNVYLAEYFHVQIKMNTWSFDYQTDLQNKVWWLNQTDSHGVLPPREG